MMEALLDQGWLIVWTLIKVLMVVLPLIFAVAYLSYVERRVIGFIQNRYGPNRVGPFGVFQPIADVLKLFLKEIIIPSRSNRYLYLMAPVLALAPALAAWAVIPFDQGLVLSNINVGLLFIFAMTSVGIYGIIIAGWASNSRYAFLGALRSSAQIVSYEIPMGFCLVGVLMLSGSMNLSEIVLKQSGGIMHWFFLPLFPLFIIYWISAVAETNRSPFDVAEGESEIVAGFHVEYAGITFGLFFLAEYANMILVSCIASLLFLGGWLSPFEGMGFLSRWFAWVPGIFWLFFKVSGLLLLFLWFRATFPRYRYDQIMRLGWKVFIPITLLWIIVLCFAKGAQISPWFKG